MSEEHPIMADDKMPTAGPWVRFSDEGKTVALMAAMRPIEICSFENSPSEADARLMVAAPSLFDALIDCMEFSISDSLARNNNKIAKVCAEWIEIKKKALRAISIVGDF